MISTGKGTESQPGLAAWVEAAPFRAHLRHVMSVSGLSLESVALLAGVSPRCAFHLLYGRRGRAVRRISPETARQLLQVTPGDARATRSVIVPAAATGHHLRRLLGAGWCEAELAQLLGLNADEVAAIVAGADRSCTQLAALRAAAEVSLLLTPLPADPTRARAAA